MRCQAIIFPFYLVCAYNGSPQFSKPQFPYPKNRENDISKGYSMGKGDHNSQVLGQSFFF